jgi:hypothetical protein
MSEQKTIPIIPGSQWTKARQSANSPWSFDSAVRAAS